MAESPDGFRVTYEYADGPPPMEFDEYAKSTMAAFRKLLAEDPPETSVQQFLEHHPSLVPGAQTPAGGYGHPAWNEFLVTQPVLPGLASLKPDFMWIAQHSDSVFPTFVEIEAPGKRLFRMDGVPTAAFTQARDQLAEWKQWLRAPANFSKFVEDYGLTDLFGSRRVSPRFILVLGRRQEFEGNPRLTKKRAELMSDSEYVMSYDRLECFEQLEDAITVTHDAGGRWKAVAVAPTFGLTAEAADRLNAVVHLEDVIDTTEGISRERAGFLRDRIGYWRQWASTNSAARTYAGFRRE